MPSANWPRIRNVFADVFAFDETVERDEIGAFRGCAIDLADLKVEIAALHIGRLGEVFAGDASVHEDGLTPDGVDEDETLFAIDDAVDIQQASSDAVRIDDEIDEAATTVLRVSDGIRRPGASERRHPLHSPHRRRRSSAGCVFHRSALRHRENADNPPTTDDLDPRILIIDGFFDVNVAAGQQHTPSPVRVHSRHGCREAERIRRRRR